jgi:CubicO group peptidase (beta-lactamase class C family)
MRRIRLVLLPVLAAVAGSHSLRAQQKPWDKGFDAQIDSVLKAWKVPGVAIGIVKGDKVILAKGYGYKDAEAKAPVSTQTKFAIGSVTKSFAVTSMAVLVKQGKLSWDKPVRDYLPDFRLFDEVATDRMTPRDLVTHRSGLPRHDLLWYGSPLTRDEMLARLRFLEPSREFRSYWQYQNLMFMTAGYLAGKLYGKTWEETARDLVFAPLGMTTADLSANDLPRSADFAYAYGTDKNDSVHRLPFRNLDNVGPAGSINANVDEMLHYLRMHLNQGTYEGREIIKAADAREMQTPQMVIPSGPPSPDPWYEVGSQQYGMGFFITTYRGHKLVHHGGNIDGFSAELNFLPYDSLGVVVLTNLNGTPTRDFIPYLVYDRILGLSPIDWSARFKKAVARGKASADSARSVAASKRKSGTQPSHPLTDFAGTYSHPGYGKITVAAEGGALRLRFNTFDVPLKHFHYDVFETDPDPLKQQPEWKLMFQMDVDGNIASLAVPIEPAIKPAVFSRDK